MRVGRIAKKAMPRLCRRQNKPHPLAGMGLDNVLPLCGEDDFGWRIRKHLFRLHHPLDCGGEVGRAVKDRLHGHRAERQLGKIATLEVFRDRVVESPQGTPLELRMARIAELLNGRVNVAAGECLGIYQVDEQVSGTIPRDFGLLVSVDALAHIVPMRNHATNGIRKNARKIVQDVRCMTTSKLDVRRETEILTDHHAIANADRSGEGLVVRVAKTKHDLPLRIVHGITLEGKAAEVAKTTARKRVFLFLNFQTRAIDCLASEVDEREVRNRHERIRGFWSFNADELIGVDLVFCDDECHLVFVFWG